MKKIIMLVMALVLLVPVVNAQNKALEKALKKEYKTKMKQYKKELLSYLKHIRIQKTYSLNLLLKEVNLLNLNLNLVDHVLDVVKLHILNY